MATSVLESAIQPLLLERIDSDSALKALADEWNALAGDVPFCSHEWLATWWRHYASGNQELFVIALRTADGELVAIAPWYVSTTLGAVRVLRQLGSGEVASDYVSILVQPRYAQHATSLLAAWLAGEAANRWDLIELEALRADDPIIESLVEAVRGHGHLVEQRNNCRTWRVPMATEWDRQLSGLSKSRRELLRRLSRRAFDNGRAIVHVVRNDDDWEKAWPILVDLHQRRRKSLGEPGCFASDRFANFHRHVSRLLLASGRLRLRWLELEGKPIAVEYSLTGGTTVFYYQSGIDPDLAEEQPGWLSLIASLRDSIQEGTTVFDFLRGDEPYKASLGGEPQPLLQTRIVGRGVRARAHHQAWRAGSRAKRLAKLGVQYLRDLRQANTATPPKPTAQQSNQG